MGAVSSNLKEQRCGFPLQAISNWLNVVTLFCSAVSHELENGASQKQGDSCSRLQKGCTFTRRLSSNTCP